MDKIRAEISRLLVFGFMFLILGFASVSFGQDKIVAIVNNEVITQKDMNDFANFMRIEFQGEYKGDELEKKIQEMRQDLLNKLIEDRLILQEARKAHMGVDPAKVKARIDEVRSHYPTDVEFQKALMQQGLVQADLESKIREQVMMRDVIEKEVKEKLSINPSEVTDLYNKNTSEFKSLELRDVQAVKIQDEAKVKALRQELISGKSPDTLAGEYTFEVDNIEISQNKEFRPEIENAVFKLGPGELSEPIKVDQVFYIFKLEKVVPSRQLKLSEVQENIHGYLFNIKMKEALANWLDSLHKHSYIKITQE
ncbi:MAG: peptidyl-prolyl cis-trans isomerase [Candidatus Omnitrophica bacterium]|nr:peptidyl-prolyl cis-trans isomerase [Candidatus Omnitrophota bacterium]